MHPYPAIVWTTERATEIDFLCMYEVLIGKSLIGEKSLGVEVSSGGKGMIRKAIMEINECRYEFQQ